MREAQEVKDECQSHTHTHTHTHTHPCTVLIRNRASEEGSQQLTPGNVPQLLGPGPRCPRKAGGGGGGAGGGECGGEGVPPRVVPRALLWGCEDGGAERAGPAILWVPADPFPQEGPDGKLKG